MAEVEVRQDLQEAHQHKCPECGKEWTCRLMLGQDKVEFFGVTVEGRKPCWGDVSPLCAKCTTPEKLGFSTCTRCKRLFFGKANLCGMCLYQNSLEPIRARMMAAVK